MRFKLISSRNEIAFSGHIEPTSITWNQSVMVEGRQRHVVVLGIAAKCSNASPIPTSKRLAIVPFARSMVTRLVMAWVICPTQVAALRLISSWINDDGGDVGDRLDEVSVSTGHERPWIKF